MDEVFKTICNLFGRYIRNFSIESQYEVQSGSWARKVLNFAFVLGSWARKFKKLKPRHHARKVFKK